LPTQQQGPMSDPTSMRRAFVDEPCTLFERVRRSPPVRTSSFVGRRDSAALEPTRVGRYDRHHENRTVRVRIRALRDNR
jgi:hypothetical protein